MNIAHITQRLAGCHGTGCATHQGKACDCGPVASKPEKEKPSEPGFFRRVWTWFRLAKGRSR